MNRKRVVDILLILSAGSLAFLVTPAVSRIVGDLREENHAAAQQHHALSLAQHLESTVTGQLQGTTQRLGTLAILIDTAVGRRKPDNTEVLVSLETARRITDASLVYVLILLLSVLLLATNLVNRRRAAKALEAANRHLETRVEERTRDLALANDELQKEIAERERVQQALEQARQAAEAANLAKSEFLANMSHEIRTPMTAILGFADILLDDGPGGVGRAERIDATRTIKRNCECLLQVINDILDLSKIEAGSMNVEKVPCSLEQIISEVLSIVRVPADAKGLPIHVQYAERVPGVIRTDPVRVRQILANLMANAVKFTEVGEIRMIIGWHQGEKAAPPGHEDSTQEADKAVIEFNIQDTGIGLAPDQVARLFQPFSQADTSTTRQYGGTGLGLTISKRLARLLGGDVTLVQTKQGQGSHFRFWVGIGRAKEATADCGTSQCRESGAGSAPDEPQTVGLKGRTVLLAEDRPDNQRLISHLLRKEGACVTVVENGLLAVARVFDTPEQTPFDVILMDMQMPVMDGYDAAAELRRRGYTGTIIALTAHAMSSDRDKCLAAGCDEYITKPINRSELVKVISRRLGVCAAAQTVDV